MDLSLIGHSPTYVGFFVRVFSTSVRIMKISSKVEELSNLIRPAVEACGVSLWGVEFLRQGAQSLLRVYIDKDTGVTIDDCASVTHQIGGVLDVHDPIVGEYVLEVSSPGIDKPFFEPAHFGAHIGQKVQVRTIDAIQDNQGNKLRKIVGQLHAIDNNGVRVDDIFIDFDNIDRANLVYEG